MSDSLITKKAIAAALKQVCREKPFDKISKMCIRDRDIDPKIQARIRKYENA